MRFVVSFLLITLLLSTLNPLFSMDPWWGKDKVKHFAFSYILTNYLSKNPKRPLDKKKAFLLTFSLGVCKEVWDRFKRKREFSYKDLCYDLVGSLLGSL